MSNIRFVFIVLFISASLVFTVYLRSGSNRSFYMLRAAQVKQLRAQHRLWQKQLLLAGLLNPSSIQEHMGQ